MGPHLLNRGRNLQEQVAILFIGRIHSRNLTLGHLEAEGTGVHPESLKGGRSLQTGGSEITLG